MTDSKIIFEGASLPVGSTEAQIQPTGHPDERRAVPSLTWLYERFGKGVECRGSTAPTGEKFVSFDCGGIHVEGEQSLLVSDQDVACALLTKSIACYAEGRVGVLYIRVLPEISYRDYLPNDFPEILDDRIRNFVTMRLWQGYARLLISEKPVIPTNINED